MTDWIILERAPNRRVRAKCPYCGDEDKWYFDYALGSTKSCGCARAELVRKANSTHGETLHKTHSKEYRTWRSMRRRCRDVGSGSYCRYGALGITVCERWAHSFENFLEDVGRAPSEQHTIDRIDYTKNYEPGNVKWSTPKEQANNRKSSAFFTGFGKTQTLQQWAEEYGIRQGTLWARLNNSKLSLEEALTKPVKNATKAVSRKDS